LNYIKQRFVWGNKADEANKVARFQSPIDQPYKEFRAAAAVFSSIGYDEASIQATNAKSIKIKKTAMTIKHPHHDNLKMIVVKGDDLMALVHNLYQRAADEA
jgi:hypothetical protein